MRIDLRTQRLQLRARGQNLQVLLLALLVDLLFPQALILEQDRKLFRQRVQKRVIGAHKLHVAFLRGDLDGAAHLTPHADGGAHSRPARRLAGGGQRNAGGRSENPAESALRTARQVLFRDRAFQAGQEERPGFGGGEPALE